MGDQAVGLEDGAHFLVVVALVQAACAAGLAWSASGFTGKLWRVSSSSLKSLRLAPATERPTGTPPPSTHNERLVPCLLRSTGEGPVFFPRQGSLGHRPVDAHPGPVDAVEGVVFSQARLPKSQEEAVLDPRLEAVVRRGGGTKAGGVERRSTGSRCAARKRSPPRTPDPARGAARRRADACCDARAKAARSSVQSSSVNPKQPPVLGDALGVGSGGGLSSWQARSSPTCIVSRHAIIRIGSKARMVYRTIVVALLPLVVFVGWLG